MGQLAGPNPTQPTFLTTQPNIFRTRPEYTRPNPTQASRTDTVQLLSNSFMSVISMSHQRAQCILILSNTELIISSKWKCHFYNMLCIKMCRHSTALAKIFRKTKICSLDPTQPTWCLKFVTQPNTIYGWSRPIFMSAVGYSRPMLCMHWNTYSDRSIYRMQLKLSTQGFLAIFFQGLVI